MTNDVVTRAIDAVCAGDHLTADHAATVLAEIMEGRTSEVQTAAFLIALRAKGETVPELVGLARTMRALATPVATTRTDLVDTAGTGGGPSTFNVSTTAALVAAAAGCAVAKHGNRSATSKCGSAELLEALGVNIELEPEQVGHCIDEVGFGFMFAPRHHKATAHVVPVRMQLGVRTIFNFLGPLTNPAGAPRQLLGVSDRHYQETIAEALVGLGSERALVVSAEDGVDELSISARTRVIEVRDGRTEEHYVEAGDFGLASAELRDVVGGTPEQNAAASRGVFAGEQGPRRDLVLLNAGAAIYVGGGAESLAAGVEKAAAAIDSGATAELLGRLIEATNSAAV
jgi:anthranilate phosphoribosyltransferase